MRSVPSIIFAVLIAVLGSSWLFFEAEIREYLGWPKVEEVEDVEEEEGGPSEERPERVPSERPKVTDQADGEVEPTKEEVIQRIVSERYPDLPAKSFSEQFPSLDKIPAAAFPDRIQTQKEVAFYRRSGNAVLSASRVKEGGFVRPQEILPDGQLVVSSLADQGMTAMIPLSETNLVEKATERYEDSLRRAQERIIEMREADASDLRSDSRLFRRVTSESGVWSESLIDPPLVDSLFTKLDPEVFSIVGHYELGRKRIQVSERSGVYTVTLFLVQGMDDGFGPYYWRVQSLKATGGVIEWLGLPD